MSFGVFLSCRKGNIPDDVAYKEHNFPKIFEKGRIKIIRETDSTGLPMYYDIPPLQTIEFKKFGKPRSLTIKI